MKKLFTTAIILLGIFEAQAQVGINTDTPNTTLDVRGKVDGSGVSLPTDVTGLQAPRLTRAELTSKGDALYGTNHTGALVYITDISAGNTLTQRVNITAVGYYYFDGALWQKVGGGSSTGADTTNDAWINNDPNNSVDLPYAALKDDVSYTATGYKQYDKTNPPIEALIGGVKTAVNYKTYQNIYDNSYALSTSIPTIDATTLSHIQKYSTLLVNSSETRANQVFVSTASNAQVAGNSSLNLSQLRGSTFTANHFGTGTVGQILGAAGSAYIYDNGKTNFLYGTTGAAVSATSQNIGEIGGMNSVTSLRTGQTGTITNSYLFGGTASTGANISGNVTNNFGLKLNYAFPATYSGTITNSYDVYANDNNALNINNKYGLYLLGASKKSYLEGSLGIGTAAGVATNQLHVAATANPVRFEGLQAGSSADNIVVADATTGVLRTIASTSITSAPKFFYAPSVVLPTANVNLPTGITYDAGTQTFTANLYSIYSNQFGMTGDVAGASRTAIRSDAAISLPVETASNLAYFVTYFDNTVYDPSSITLSTAGVMTYKILASAAVTEKTFMNIVFKVK